MNKEAIFIIAALIILSFSFGRYSAPEKIKIETKTVTVEVEKVKTNENTDNSKTVTEIIRPDHTIIKRTRYDKKTDKITQTITESRKEVQESKEITKGSKVTIAALGSLNLTHLTSGITYGLSASKPFLGPITMGIFGFTDSSFGLSMGVEF